MELDGAEIFWKEEGGIYHLFWGSNAVAKIWKHPINNTWVMNMFVGDYLHPLEDNFLSITDAKKEAERLISKTYREYAEKWTSQSNAFDKAVAKEWEKSTDIRQSTACFTGRRPKGLWGYKPERNEYGILKSIVKDKVASLVRRGYRRFITGGAQGFDQVAFLAVHEFKMRHPEIPVENVLYVPCREQDKKWAETGYFGKADYKQMLKLATDIVYVHYRPYESAKDLMDRNHAMVDASSVCVALWPEGEDFHAATRSGTAECMRYAEQKGLSIEVINPGEVELELALLPPVKDADVVER